MVAALAVGKEIDDFLYIAVANHAPQPDAGNVVERHHDFQAAGFDFQEVKPFHAGANRAAANLLDNSYTVAGIDDFVTDIEIQVRVAAHQGHLRDVGAVRLRKNIQ